MKVDVSVVIISIKISLSAYTCCILLSGHASYTAVRSSRL